MQSSNNEPTFLDMNDLCDDSLEASDTALPVRTAETT